MVHQCVEFFIFASVSFLSNLIFLFNKKHGLLGFKMSIKIIEKPHTALLPGEYIFSKYLQIKASIKRTCGNLKLTKQPTQSIV